MYYADSGLPFQLISDRVEVWSKSEDKDKELGPNTNR